LTTTAFSHKVARLLPLPFYGKSTVAIIQPLPSKHKKVLSVALKTMQLTKQEISKQQKITAIPK